MRKALASVSLCALAALFSAGAQAQDTGTITKAVGGYTFEQAAKEAEATKNFHSADGHLTFAIVTHTAGNGFFDPVYVGATAAGNMIGAKILLLGSESPTDDVVREIEILNQIIQDPTIDGLILTTPQVGAYNDIVKKLLDKGLDKGSILFPSQTTAGNVEVNNRVVAAFDQVVKDLNAAGKLANFTVDAGPEKIGIAVNDQDIPGSIVTLLESRGDVVGIFGPNGAVTPAIVTAISQTKKEGQICAYGYDLGPPILEGLKSGALTGSLGQQPFLQGFWPVMQLYLQIDRGIAAANLDTRAQVVTKENVATVGKRFEN